MTQLVSPSVRLSNGLAKFSAFGGTRQTLPTIVPKQQSDPWRMFIRKAAREKKEYIVSKRDDRAFYPGERGDAWIIG